LILLIDNYDSFTYNLVDYFEQLGVSVRIIMNDTPLKNFSLDGVKGIVVSPGPETPEKANHLNDLLEMSVGQVPILGICLGHQALAVKLGAKLEKAEKPMHGKISEIETKGGVVFKGLPKNMEVVRYHSLLIKELPKGLKPLAKTKKNELMAFEDLNRQIHGIQFHPEAALTQYGLEMLRNWLTFYNIV